jgi:hypothetical protein
MPVDTYDPGRYPHLSSRIRQQLRAIEPSVGGELKHYPCAATLIDGETLPCVYIVQDKPYLKYCGIYPENDRGRNSVRLQEIAKVVDSPFRLPAKFATELYEHGESGMGYTIFTVVFADGSRQAYGMGNAVDFIHYPEGKSATDVVGVLPHEGRRAELWGAPRYLWCLYSEELLQ